VKARARPARRWRGPCDCLGFVTAETAVALPALMLVLAGVLTVAHGAAVQMAAQDAAALGARAAARGDADAQVRRLAGAVAPRGATVVVQRSTGLVRVRVRVAVLPRGGVAGMLGDFEVSAEAVAADDAAAGAPP
jgi:Flp pilus assembly protein TadG